MAAGSNRGTHRRRLRSGDPGGRRLHLLRLSLRRDRTAGRIGERGRRDWELMHAWRKLRVYLSRKVGRIEFIWVVQETAGDVGLHVLVDPALPDPWVSHTWAALGGSPIPEIRAIPIREAARYLSLALRRSPRARRRIGRSRSPDSTLGISRRGARTGMWIKEEPDDPHGRFVWWPLE